MKIALDWTPNPIHTGLFVAKHKGWLDLQCISPSEDNYAVMPTEKMLRGEVEFCIGPPEGLIQHHMTEPDPQLLAVAPILRENTSAFVSRKDSGIRTIQDWSGKRYAALDLPYEKGILTAMTEQAGENVPEVNVPAKLDTWKMLLSGEIDLTWVFLPVEGAEAAYLQVPLSVFRPEEYGIPYPPCPVIQTTRSLAEAEPGVVKSFLEAVSRGYQYAIAYPEESVHILSRFEEEVTAPKKLLYIQRAVSSYYYLSEPALDYPGQALSIFVEWLWKRGLLTHMPAVEKMTWKA